MLKFLSKIFGDPNKRSIKKLEPIVEKINSLEKKFEKLKDSDFPEKTKEFKKRLKKGETLNDILPEAFALVREASKRTIGLRHFDVQILAGIVLHQGKIAEQKTGEGKTLTATLPLYLNALEEKGCHLVTVNDYLAKRDTVWMGKIYDFLGLKVGCITHEASYIYDPLYTKEKEEKKEEESKTASFKVFEEHLRPISRREAYLCDITYGTNNEFGFDYLRDNLVYDISQIVQREHNFAIVDEVDSILIDEARTPLIISQPDVEGTKKYYEFAKYVNNLEENIDYNIDYKMHAVSLTEHGIKKLTKILKYDPFKTGDVGILHHITQALKAKALYKRDRDYVVKDGQVIIVDEFTGRLLYGRRFSEGLHQAIEAKEGVEVKEESKTLATITFQNYFRMYKKLAGMTGTAATSSEEFFKVYGLEVVVIPTHKPMIRKDHPDKIYKTEKEKFEAIVKEVIKRYKIGQPILIGTRSIEKNEIISRYLKKAGIPHNVLNAKNHEKEGQIIAQAGKFKAVTVATNMAGRGVDIILGGNPPDPENRKKVIKAGGLFVLGTERHEARRIDNQLRGRSGRQGDPGESQFFISLEDEILRILGGEKIKAVMTRFKVPEGEPIENAFISNLIEKAQAKIEALNFDLRQHVLKYDDVVNIHRQTIYRMRKNILISHKNFDSKKESFPLEEKFYEFVKNYIENLADNLLPIKNPAAWNIEELTEEIKTTLPIEFDLHQELISLSKTNLNPTLKQKKIKDYLYQLFKQKFENKKRAFKKDKLNDILKFILLQNIDFHWQNHLTTLQEIRDAVRLRGYAQKDPLVEYKIEAKKAFSMLTKNIEYETVSIFYKIEEPKIIPEEKELINIELKKEELFEAQQQNSSQKIQTKNQVFYEFKEKKDIFGKKIGRNQPCPCGSGKKYKKCHGRL